MDIKTLRLLLFFVLPFFSLLMYPPSMLLSAVTSVSGIIMVVIVVGLIIALGFFMSRGSQRMLTLAIFIQGLNVVIRTMMLFSWAKPEGSDYNWPFIITSLISIALSIYILFALDRPDVRGQMA